MWTQAEKNKVHHPVHDSAWSYPHIIYYTLFIKTFGFNIYVHKANLQSKSLNTFKT